MIYSAAVLHVCVGAREALLARTFHSSATKEDIIALTQSRKELQIKPSTHISTVLQQMVDRIVEYIKRCSECYPSNSDRMFWMQEHHCVWMLIYWVCDTFEAFAELFEAIGTRSPNFQPVSQNCLVVSSLLRKDMEFPPKFLSFMDIKTDWVLNTTDIFFVAIRNDDIVLLKTALQKFQRANMRGWDRLWRVAYTRLNWDAMDVLFSITLTDCLTDLPFSANLTDLGDLSPSCFHETLFWLVENRKWDELQTYAHFIRLRVKPPIKSIDYDRQYPNTDEMIVHSCAEIIHKGNLRGLESFLDIIQGLDILFDVPSSPIKELQTQLAILPALASRKLSILKLLSETGVISSSKKLINFEYRQVFGTENHWPLDLAIAFVLDLEIIEYLCRAGARLHEDSNGTFFRKQEILQKLHRTSSVADAREQNCHLKALFYRPLNYPPHKKERRRVAISNSSYRPIGYSLSESMIKTLAITERIIFEGDCRHLYNISDVSPGSTWQQVQNDLYQGKLKDASIPMATSWPAPLSTQEKWDNWRLKVIDILEEL